MRVDTTAIRLGQYFRDDISVARARASLDNASPHEVHQDAALKETDL